MPYQKFHFPPKKNSVGLESIFSFFNDTCCCNKVLLGIATTQVVAKNNIMYCNNNRVAKYMTYILIKNEKYISLFSFHTRITSHAVHLRCTSVFEHHLLLLNTAGSPPLNIVGSPTVLERRCSLLLERRHIFSSLFFAASWTLKLDIFILHSFSLSSLSLVSPFISFLYNSFSICSL